MVAGMRVEHLDDGGRAAALRGQRPGLDALRTRSSPVRPETTIDSGGASGQGRIGELAPPRPFARSCLDNRLAVAGGATLYATSAGWLHRGEQRPRAIGAELLPPHPASQSGAEWAIAAASGVESSPSSVRGQRLPLAAARRRIALTKPDGMPAPAILTSSTAWSTAAWSGVPSEKSSS